MWGAIIGDLAGSIYEYSQIKTISNIKINKLIEENSFYSDDTILTIAILDAILNDLNYEKYLRKYALEYSDYKPNFNPYFKSTFSSGFTKWAKSDEIGNSKCNGAMMRISAVGYLFNNEEEVIKNVLAATIPSHNSEEAINSATIIAMVIFLARKGLTKIEIVNKLKLTFSYDPFTKFNSTCSETISNCLYALFKSDSYEEAIIKVISYGGDTDTNACIVGSMAEALYGLDKKLILEASAKIPEAFVRKLEMGYAKIK